MELVENINSRILFDVVNCYIILCGADMAFAKDVSIFIENSYIGFVHGNGVNFPAKYAKQILGYAGANNIPAEITYIDENIVILFSNIN